MGSLETWAIAGLGNPGLKYSSTRHNAGYWVLDKLCELHSTSFATMGSNWKEEKSCLVQGLQENYGRLLLIKPQLFMNLSGKALKACMQFRKISADNLLVVHDELDLEAGRIQVKSGGSASGHRGIEDVIANLGTRDFLRIRVGIGRPEKRESGESMSISDWVLSPPRPKEKELIEEATFNAAKAVGKIISEGIVAAQQEFNRR